MRAGPTCPSTFHQSTNFHSSPNFITLKSDNMRFVKIGRRYFFGWQGKKRRHSRGYIEAF